MRKKYILSFLLLNISLYSFCGDFSYFPSVNSKSAKSFAGDLGAVMGGGVSYTSRSLGFSGFDLGYRTSYQLKPSKDSSFMPKERAFGINFLQAEIGMPYRIDAFIRASFGDKLTVVGGGIKYGLWKIKDGLYQMNGMLIINSHMANNLNFYAIQNGINAIFSMNCGVIRPFILLGYDSTRLTVQNALDPSLVNKNFYEAGERIGAGLRFKMKWVNLSAAYEYSRGNNIVNGAFTVRF